MLLPLFFFTRPIFLFPFLHLSLQIFNFIIFTARLFCLEDLFWLLIAFATSISGWKRVPLSNFRFDFEILLDHFHQLLIQGLFYIPAFIHLLSIIIQTFCIPAFAIFEDNIFQSFGRLCSLQNKVVKLLFL